VEWRDAESGVLRGHVRLTSPEEFLRAGEAYFSPDGERIIFQASPRPGNGAEPSPHYSMYIADLEFDGAGRVVGMDDPVRISPAGSANTCGFFDPTDPSRVIFGSTIEPPASPGGSGYQRESRDYRWEFPEGMEVVTRPAPPVDAAEPQVEAEDLRPLWRRPGYDAECAFSPDGRFIVHTRVDPETGDGDIWVFDTRTQRAHPIVTAPGYDGGPFFSPDGTRICYRSDRRGDDLLQIFVADLKFNDAGVPLGMQREHTVTDNRHVNWAPFWHPSGEFLIYTTSELGHRNYEVFAVEAPPPGAQTEPRELARRRVTRAAGFDGLPVFNADGSLMMWTSQRALAEAPDEGGTSQIWVAEVIDVSP